MDVLGYLMDLLLNTNKMKLILEINETATICDHMYTKCLFSQSKYVSRSDSDRECQSSPAAETDD